MRLTNIELDKYEMNFEEEGNIYLQLVVDNIEIGTFFNVKSIEILDSYDKDPILTINGSPSFLVKLTENFYLTRVNEDGYRLNVSQWKCKLQLKYI